MIPLFKHEKYTLVGHNLIWDEYGDIVKIGNSWSEDTGEYSFDWIVMNDGEDAFQSWAPVLNWWRWKGDISCPYCGDKDFNRLPDGATFNCNSCEQDFTAKSKTVMDTTRCKKFYYWSMMLVSIEEFLNGTANGRSPLEEFIFQEYGKPDDGEFILDRIRIVVDDFKIGVDKIMKALLTPVFQTVKNIKPVVSAPNYNRRMFAEKRKTLITTPQEFKKDFISKSKPYKGVKRRRDIEIVTEDTRKRIADIINTPVAEIKEMVISSSVLNNISSSVVEEKKVQKINPAERDEIEKLMLAKYEQIASRESLIFKI